MGGSWVVLQDHPVSDYHPAQDKVETPILKDILHAFFFYLLSLTIPHSALTDELAALRVPRDRPKCLQVLSHTLGKKVTQTLGHWAPEPLRGRGKKLVFTLLN